LGTVATLAALPIGIIAMPQDRASALVPFLLSSAIFCTIYAILGWQLDYLPRFRGGGKDQSHGGLHPVISHLAADERLTEPSANRDETSGTGGVRL
jgi:hypothetical protein